MVKKRATAKKSTAKKSVKRSKRFDGYVSFKLQPNDRPFIQFAVTRQTVYWGLLSALILVLGAYVIYLQSEISTIYDQVQTNSIEADAAEVKSKAKKD